MNPSFEFVKVEEEPRDNHCEDRLSEDPLPNCGMTYVNEEEFFIKDELTEDGDSSSTFTLRMKSGSRSTRRGKRRGADDPSPQRPDAPPYLSGQAVTSNTMPLSHVDKAKKCKVTDTETQELPTKDSLKAEEDMSVEEDLNHPWPHLETFYGPVVSKKGVIERGKVVIKGIIVCRLCKTKLAFNTYSLYSLKSHYYRVHPDHSDDLVAAISRGSRRGRFLPANSGHNKVVKRVHQPSTESTLAGSSAFNNSKPQELLYRCMIGDMLPAKLIESPHLLALFKCLNPHFKVPSRQNYMRTLKKKAELWKAKLTTIFETVQYVATTADCWTSHKRSFLGMTAHWIDQSTLIRKKAVLTCTELPVARCYDILANSIKDVHQKFLIEAKITRTTTDNGRNFGDSKDSTVAQDDSDEDDPMTVDEDNPMTMDEEDAEDTEETQEVQPVDLAQLIEEERARHRPGDTLILPGHHRCVAHTLILLATVDVEEVPSWSSGSHPCFSKVRAKAQALWNKQRRKPTFTATIKREVGRKLKTPDITRWNSLYNSVEELNGVLNMKLAQINAICLYNNLSSFDETDKDVITEYLAVMKPVVNSFDKLQSEKEAYMGVLLPTLYILRNRLENMRTKNLKYAQPLLDYLLDSPVSEEKSPKGFKARFSALFSEMDLLIATAIHPHFKLPVVRLLNPNKVDMVRSRLLEEIRERAAANETVARDRITEENEEDDFFKELEMNLPGSEGVELNSHTHFSNKLSKEFDTWCSEKENKSTSLDHSMFPTLCRAAWVDVFLKYNTGIPSSAAVEKLFSRGSDVMKPQMATLTSESFEQLVFLKGNMDLLSPLSPLLLEED